MKRSSEEVKGYVHSIETLGTLDGPGTRCVLFMQGCFLRCKYCHNPDTWQIGICEAVSADELLSKIIRYKSYFGENGGVTVSGGEPLVQAEFVNEFFSLCKQEKIHTALDTAGYELNDSVKRVIRNTDLVLLDIKHTDPAKYYELTGGQLKTVLEFLDYITSIKTPLWVRQVIVPGYNDTAEEMLALAELLKGKMNLQKIELLAYHQMGIEKWRELGLKYHFEKVSPPDQKRMADLSEVLVRQGLPARYL